MTLATLLTEDVIIDMADGSDDVACLLGHTQPDLDRYLARVESV